MKNIYIQFNVCLLNKYIGLYFHIFTQRNLILL